MPPGDQRSSRENADRADKRARSQAVTKRWRDIAVYAIVASLIFLVGAPVFVRCLQRRGISSWAFSPVTVLSLSLLTYWLGKHWARPWRIGHLLSYPPPSFAAALGALFVCMGWWVFPETLTAILPNDISTDTFWLAAEDLANGSPLIPSAFWLAFSFISIRLNCAPSNSTARLGDEGGPPKESALPKDFDEICRWVRNDKEIEDPTQDYFGGHTAVADRIADRLLQGKTDMALVGALGSGKSSILRLAKRTIESRSDSTTFLVVEVSLWPFDTPEAAVRGILNALVRQFGFYVSPLALVGLSESYLRGVEKLPGIWAVLGAITRPPSSPEELLERLDQAALAANLRVLLWVEDLERFAGTTEDGGLPGTPERETERLNPIRSLLHLLHRLSRVSVVVASHSLHARFDMEKIARFVEKTPVLPSDRIWELLYTFRNGCLRKQKFVDPVAGRCDPKRTPLARQRFDEDASLTQATMDHAGERWPAEHDVRHALCELCRNPRKLKFAMRACLDAWDRLWGEIDFDDILMMSVLREAEPNVFASLEEHFDDLRKSVPTTSTQSALDTHLDPELSPRKAAVEHLLVFVFPAFRLERNESNKGKHLQSLFRLAASSDRDWTYQVRPQGLTVPEYWRRYLALVPPPGQKDQEILQWVDDWKRGRNEGLLDMIEGPSAGSEAVAFAGMLDAEALIRLLVGAVARAARRAVDAWSDADPVRLRTVASMMAGGVPLDDLEPELCHLVRTTACSNLNLANSLLSRFVPPDDEDRRHFVEASAAFRILSDFAKSIAECPRDDLARAADVGAERLRQYPLRNTCELLWRNALEGNSSLAAQWDPARDRILEAATAHPQILVPQLVMACVHDDQLGIAAPSSAPRFASENAERFGVERLRRILDSSPVPPSDSSDLTRAYEAVNRGLRASVPST